MPFIERVWAMWMSFVGRGDVLGAVAVEATDAVVVHLDERIRDQEPIQDFGSPTPYPH
jgi:hypothetical protein